MKQVRTQDQASSMIREAGYKVTAPRLLVLSLLQKAKYPLSIKNILKKTGKNKIDQVTIYRILDAFKRAGIVNQIDFQKDCAYYELKDIHHDHHHIVCVQCNDIKDFVGCEYEKLAEKALQQVPEFAHITSHSLEFFGLCNTCNSKK